MDLFLKLGFSVFSVNGANKVIYTKEDNFGTINVIFDTKWLKYWVFKEYEGKQLVCNVDYRLNRAINKKMEQLVKKREEEICKRKQIGL